MTEGRFIVLEGVDGAGTTTHTRIIADTLRGRGLPIATTREPSDGPIGMMIRQILSGRIVVPAANGPRPPSWGTLALLFAADRLDHIEAEIVPHLLDGTTVLSDRYVHSSIAYQSLSSGGGPDTLAWIRNLNVHARKPDLTIVLDAPAQITRTRRQVRAGRDGLYEHDELQDRLVEFYRNIEQYFPGETIVHVDTNRDFDAVAADIHAHVDALLNR